MISNPTLFVRSLQLRLARFYIIRLETRDNGKMSENMPTRLHMIVMVKHEAQGLETCILMTHDLRYRNRLSNLRESVRIALNMSPRDFSKYRVIWVYQDKCRSSNLMFPTKNSSTDIAHRCYVDHLRVHVSRRS